MERGNHPDEAWEKTWEVFHRALERAPSERASFLAAACDGDLGLRREVEGLLEAHESDSAILDRRELIERPPEITPDEKSRPSQPLTGGTVLANRFAIVRLLGAGGMGEVYEALDRDLGRSIAVKLIPQERSLDSAAMARFRQEIVLAREVTHRNVCRVFDLFRDGERAFLTMELLEGETLAARLLRTGRLSPDESREIVVQIAAALEAAHERGVIHRDLKPSNIVLVDDAAGQRAVVTDFGMATSHGADAESSRLTRSGEITGTLAYMSPEQLQGEPVGPYTDVYALGLVLFEMLTGRAPFEGENPYSVAGRRLDQPAPSPRALMPELDERWDAAVRRCLRRRPTDRFQRPRDLLDALELEASVQSLGNAGRPGSFALWALALLALILVSVSVLVLRGRLPRIPVAATGAPLESPAAETSSAPWFRQFDTVLVGDIENRSGDPSLDGIVVPTLAHVLSRSSFLNVASRSRIADALQLMRLPAQTKVDREIGLRIAERDPGIRALVVGSLEGSAESPRLELQLLDPQRGPAFATWSEPLQRGTSALSSTVERLAIEIRRRLGDAPPRSESSGPFERRVTTPSPQALRLFDQADAAIPDGRSDVAEELLREAIHLDPEFASALNHLAYAIRNQGRPAAEYLPFAKRAMELSDELPSREKYFIRASYYGFVDDRSNQMKNYEILLRLHPDHFWGNNNMHHLLGNLSGYPYRVAIARYRPNNLEANFNAAVFLNLLAPRGEADPYVERVLALAGTTPSGYVRDFAVVWARLRAAHELWVDGDLESSKAVLDREAARIPSLPRFESYWTREIVTRGYRALGLAHRAHELPTLPKDRDVYQFLRGLDAFLKGDRAALVAAFTDEIWPNRVREDGYFMDPVRVVGLARAGRMGDAQKALDQFLALPHPGFLPPTVVRQRLEAILAAEKSPTDKALPLLEKAVLSRDWRGGMWQEAFGASYFLAAQELATAYRELGRGEDAAAVLEDAVAQRFRAFPCGDELWLDTEWRLAELQRALGHPEAAERIETELRDLMRLADPDFWLVERLRRRG